MRRFFFLITILLGNSLANDTYEDIHGTSHQPLDSKDYLASVIIFTTLDCPIANAYQPEIQRIAKKYLPHPIKFTLVHVDPDTSAKAARKHAEEYEITIPVIRDPKHTLVNKTKATTTPEAVVINKGGKIVYRGRINNWYYKLGARRAQATSHELRDALEALIHQRNPAVSAAPAVGCIIADLVPAKN